MKKIILKIKLWYALKKMQNAKTDFEFIIRLKIWQELYKEYKKNKGNRLATFIRQMKQR